MMEQSDKTGKPSDAGGHTPEPKRMGERLVGLLIAGIIFLNFPFLSLFGGNRTILGFPVLFSYIFFVWGLIIVAVVIILRNRPPGLAGGSGSGRSGHK